MTTFAGATASVTGALLGLALGDALGFVVEAEPPDVARDYVRQVLRAGRAGERSHPGFPFGQYSDDTQLARELLLSIVEARGWNPERFGVRLGALVLTGRDVGAGPGTRAAACRLLLGAPWTHAGTPPPYAGNGSAMRVAPLGALYGHHEAHWQLAAREQSLLTHRDPRCTAGALAVAGAAALARRPGPIDRAAFLEQLACWMEPEDAGFAAAVRGTRPWLALPPDAAVRRLHRSGLDAAHRGAWRGISAFVVPSVIWSVYAFLRSPDDWWETVCTAIGVGGDTDTMAAIAGALAGTRLGPAALPRPLLDRLGDRGRWDAPALARLASEAVGTLGPPLDSESASVILAGELP